VTNFATPLSPYDCWDWWGYTDFNYAVKAGRQIATIEAMLDRLTLGHVSTRSSRVIDGTAPNGLTVSDISDTAVALAWTPLVVALTYTAYRARGADQNFTAIGTVAGPSLSDAGLSPATSYMYKVTANAGGSGTCLTGRHGHCRCRRVARLPAAALSRAEPEAVEAAGLAL